MSNDIPKNSLQNQLLNHYKYSIDSKANHFSKQSGTPFLANIGSQKASGHTQSLNEASATYDLNKHTFMKRSRSSQINYQRPKSGNDNNRPAKSSSDTTNSANNNKTHLKSMSSNTVQKPKSESSQSVNVRPSSLVNALSQVVDLASAPSHTMSHLSDTPKLNK